MKRIFAAVFLVFIPSLALAQRWYAGGALGEARFEGCPAASSCDRRDPAYKVYAGYRFASHFAIEAGYSDYGKRSELAGASPTESKPRGGTLHLVGSWPLTADLAILARAGFIYGDTKVTSGTSVRNPRGIEPTFGVGAEYAVGRGLSVRLEAERARFDALDVDTLTLGFALAF